MNNRGQILLPGLAAFLVLLSLFFGLVALGRGMIMQQRMDMAASAAALSGARAMAQLLNERGVQNLGAFPYVNVRYEGIGEVQFMLKEEFNAWYEKQELQNGWNNLSIFWNGMKGFPAGVASHVAKLNGADKNHRDSGLDLQLKLVDLNIVFMNGDIVMGDAEYDNLFYAREWNPEKGHPQPPHMIIWSVKKGSVTSVAAARVYLDSKSDTWFQNGGFPTEEGGTSLGDLGVGAMYAQFNARLVPVPTWTHLVPF